MFKQYRFRCKIFTVQNKTVQVVTKCTATAKISLLIKQRKLIFLIMLLHLLVCFDQTSNYLWRKPSSENIQIYFKLVMRSQIIQFLMQLSF